MSQPSSYIQSVFNKGEVSNRLYGRVDNKYYYNAFRYSLNLIPYIQGAITRRTGSYYVSEVKTSSKFTRLIAFRFSTTQNYAIETGDGYMRFYRNRGRVETSPGVAYELTTPWLEADLPNLKWTQSADVLYVFCAGYQPRKITRTSDTSWTISTVVFLDGPYLPENTTAVTLNPSGTAVGASITITASAALFSTADVNRIVRMKHGTKWGYATITGYTSSTVVSATVNEKFDAASVTTAWRLGSFSNTLGWPTVGVFHEERLVVANTASYPNTIWGSVSGDFENFHPTDTDGVIADDNAFTFAISDDQVNAVYWLSSGRIMLIGTSGGEYTMTGGTASSYAPITPSNVTIKRESNFGSDVKSRVKRIANSVIHISPSRQKVRELAYDFGIDSYLSRDLTLFSQHMNLNGIRDVDYTQEPEPIFWCALDDGTLTGMTYEKQQEVEGWHRHDMGGVDSKVEALCSIPKPALTGDDLWLIVSRTIGGSTKRYVEYLTDPYNAAVNGQNTMFFVDAGLEYNGYRAGTLTPSATTGAGVTFTASSSVFVSGDVGNELWFGSSRATITGYTSGTVVTATITVAFPNTSAIATGSWAVAENTFTGLTHLNGETCRVTADGAPTDDVVPSGGSVTLNNFAARVQIGLPYDCYLNMLPIELPQFGTIGGKTRRVNKINLYLTETLGLEVSEEKLTTWEVIQFQTMGNDMGVAPPLKSGIQGVFNPYGYEDEGVLQFRKLDALPLTINYIVQELGVGN
jgi:hypothetical protein